MVLTVDVPKKLHERIEHEKRTTGLSKSYIVRQILLQYYEGKKSVNGNAA